MRTLTTVVTCVFFISHVHSGQAITIFRFQVETNNGGNFSYSADETNWNTFKECICSVPAKEACTLSTFQDAVHGMGNYLISVTATQSLTADNHFIAFVCRQEFTTPEGYVACKAHYGQIPLCSVQSGCHVIPNVTCSSNSSIQLAWDWTQKAHILSYDTAQLGLSECCTNPTTVRQPAPTPDTSQTPDLNRITTGQSTNESNRVGVYIGIGVGVGLIIMTITIIYVACRLRAKSQQDDSNQQACVNTAFDPSVYDKCGSRGTNGSHKYAHPNIGSEDSNNIYTSISDDSSSGYITVLG